MRIRTFLLIVGLAVWGIGTGTAAQADGLPVRVFVDSAFIRALPDVAATPVGSVFAEDNLLAVGRNVDGTWFEVQRPGRSESAGWIARAVLMYGFEVARLPITDFVTGVDGPEPVVETGYNAFILLEASLRTRPAAEAERLAILPIMLTLPVLDRTADRQWLRVNYRGTVGWVAEFLTRTDVRLDDVPVNPEFAVARIPAEIIPLEVQLAQVDRFRDFVRPLLVEADGVIAFWSMLDRGETIQCTPPAGEHPQYSLTTRDLFELPEVRNQERRLRGAINDLNRSIATMQRCGVFSPSDIRQAYARALNARLIFGVVLRYMDNLEVRLRQQRR